MKCWNCAREAHPIGLYEFQETQAVERLVYMGDEDAEWVVQDETYTARSWVYRCAAGHQHLTDSEGIGLEANHEIQAGFIRTSRDPQEDQGMKTS